MMAEWTPVERAAKAKDGSFLVMKDGAWIPAARVIKQKDGKFAAMMSDAAPAPAPNPDGLDKYRADPNAPRMDKPSVDAMIEQMRTESDKGEIQRVRAENPKTAGVLDFSGGMGSMTRGALNLLPGDPGTTLMGDTAYMDKESGAYLAGSLLDPVAYATGAEFAAIPKLAVAAKAPLLEKIGKGAVVGGLTGGTIGGLSNEDDRSGGASMGLGFGSIVGSLFPLGGAVVGRAYDTLTGKMPDIRVGRMINQAMGGSVDDAARTSLRNTGDVNVAQAIGKDVPAELAGIQQFASRNEGGVALDLARRQQATRMASLQSVTPDLPSAEAARGTASSANYGAARADDAVRRQVERAAANADFVAEKQASLLTTGSGKPAPTLRPDPIPEGLKKLTGNPIITAAANQARRMASSAEGLDGKLLDDATIALIEKNPMASLDGLHLMKLAIDNQFKNPSAPTGMETFAAGALNGVKKRLVAAMEDSSAGYKLARSQHAALSKPIDQSKVLTELQSKLQKAGGGERAQVFLNAVEDSTQLLKRADQNPRFATIKDILNPNQNAVVDKVTNELVRDSAINEAAKYGRLKAEDIIKQNLVISKLPNTLNTTVTVVNKALDYLGNSLNAKTLARLDKVMHDPKLVLKTIDALPAVERNLILKAMSDPAVTGRAIGMMTGAQDQ